MKCMLIALIAISFTTVFSQEMQITISANNDSITVSPDNNNKNKLLTISNSPSAGNNFLIINVVNEETDKDWKRNFFIYDSADNAVKNFVLMNDGSYCIKLSTLFTILQPQHDYFIYTTAIPKDPNKAMLVKVARRLICKIKIR